MNLFSGIPKSLPDEEFMELLAHPGIRIERIISTGQVTPPGEWLEQDWDEWVALLAGAARLMLEGETERLMQPGDHIHIPRNRRHRVTWTEEDQPTVWLAVHFGISESPPR